MARQLSIIFCVVTYRQDKQLSNLYDSLWNTYGELNSDNFIIINNHSDFIKPGPSKVLHNKVRPDQSIGYLSRSWNQSYLHGFVSSRSPLCDWVCLIQSDVIFQPGWIDRFKYLVEQKGALFVACGPGDQAVFINIAAFRSIGWWDERFCGIGYQEFDYFIRAYLKLGNRAFIQGHGIQLSHNWQNSNLIARQRELGSGHTSKLNKQLYTHLEYKWGRSIVEKIETSDPTLSTQWTKILDKEFNVNNMPKEYNWYPHFFMDDDHDYSSIYFGYTPLISRNLDIRVHGFGWDKEQQPQLQANELRLPWRIKAKRFMARMGFIQSS